MNEVGSSDVVASRSNELGSRGMSTTSWEPSQVVFRTYVSRNPSGKKAQPLRVAVKKPLVVRLSKDLVETYRLCNPHFKYSGDLKPKRYLTSPSVGVLNDGKDNANSDLILAVNDVLFSSETQQRYIVKDLLGHGTFGQVAKCWIEETNGFVAVKIIKNQPAYYQQALVEVSILTTLNKKYDPEDKNHIVRIYDYFSHQRHLCICFELLDMNLYELIKINQFRGLSLSIVQLFSKQILRGLALLKDAGIIHCDLKPENILLCSSIKPLEIKIIDFGSACMEDRTVYSYIQSRYYRSPEVLLGYQYTTAIDMWSFGCIVAELFLGLPLFPGASEFDLLRRMIEILGEQPPDYVLKEAKNTSKFFKCIGSIQNLEHAEVSLDGRSAYQTLTEEEFAVREKNKPAMGKEYFHHMNLEAIVKSYPYRKNLAEEDIAKETQIRLALIDFLRGLVEFDPAKRWSPFQASKHPFITGEPFLSPYKPPPETPRIHVYQNIKVDHHPGGGHWFAAGLSPNLSGRSRVPIQNSPRFQMAPYSHANSYGSVGSYGSYNDANRLGSSYGSYGENGNMFPYYSPVNHSGINMHNRGGVSMLGSSPDARRRIMQYSHGSGLGASPSAGNFAPAALGSSPSQFTPPSSYNQVSAGSPGHYGPTSPARNSCHGSPLGKMAAFSQYNRRKSSGYSGSPHSQDSSSSQWQGLVVDGSNYHQNEEHSQIGTGSPSHLPSKSSFTNWNQQLGGTVGSAGPSTFAPNMYARPSIGPARENPDNGLLFPDPGDWDPNYSEESLLQEDNSDERTLAAAFGRGVHLGSADTIPSVGRPSHQSAIFLNPASQSVPNQAFSQGEIANLPTYDQYGRSSHFIPKSAHFLPPASQNFPSRLGQQSVQRFNNIRSNAGRGSDWYHGKSQRPPTNSNPGGERSPRSSSYSNSVPWGRRANHPMTNIPPASRGRMDFGSIA